MKIGFIGLGNMATAMIGGIINQKIVPAGDIIGFDVLEAARDIVKSKYKITVAINSNDLVKAVDILFLAVKPQFMADVIKEIKNDVRKETIIVSIAAGKTLGFLQEHFEQENLKLVRCMPNTPALVSAGCTGVCPNKEVTSKELDEVLKIFRSFGIASEVPEHLMDVVVGVSGSAPAYVFMFIEAMADAAVAGGMPRKQAYEFAAQTVMGSAKMVLETGRHPADLKDMVCSPGGTTIDAVKVLEERGLRAAVMNAMEACIEKSRKL